MVKEWKNQIDPGGHRLPSFGGFHRNNVIDDIVDACGFELGRLVQIGVKENLAHRVDGQIGAEVILAVCLQLVEFVLQ